MRVLQFPSQYREGEAPYDIFKDRMAAIGSIVEGIKGIIENKYNKGLIDTTIDQLEKARSEQQVTDMIDLLNAEPGEEIYPGGIAKIEEMAGQFVDTFNIMGKITQGGLSTNAMGRMAQMDGGLPSGIPPTGTPPTSETMIPKGDKAQLLNAIQNIPEGQMDFAPILNYMKEHRPKMMGSFSPMEEWVMNQALGQESPKEKLSKDLALAKSYSDYFAEPTGEKSWEQTLEEANELVKNNPGYEVTSMNPKTGSITISKKEVKPEIKWEEVNERIKEYGLKLTGMNVNPNTGSVSYSFSSGETMTWEETLVKANEFMQDNPDYEVTSTNPKTGSVTISKKGEAGEDKLKDLTGTDINTFNKMFYGDENDWGAITPEEYEEAVASWGSMKKNKPAPEHISILEKALQDCLGTDNKIISRDEKNKSTDEWFKIYEWIYPYYKDALKGESPKYLPPEEIKKVGAIEGALTGGGVAKGDYGSALAGEGKPKDEKGYIVGETYRDEEGVLWKYLGNDKWEEVEEKTEKKSGKR